MFFKPPTRINHIFLSRAFSRDKPFNVDSQYYFHTPGAQISLLRLYFEEMFQYQCSQFYFQNTPLRKILKDGHIA